MPTFSYLLSSLRLLPRLKMDAQFGRSRRQKLSKDSARSTNIPTFNALPLAVQRNHDGSHSSPLTTHLRDPARAYMTGSSSLACAFSWRDCLPTIQVTEPCSLYSIEGGYQLIGTRCNPWKEGEWRIDMAFCMRWYGLYVRSTD